MVIVVEILAKSFGWTRGRDKQEVDQASLRNKDFRSQCISWGEEAHKTIVTEFFLF